MHDLCTQKKRTFKTLYWHSDSPPQRCICRGGVRAVHESRSTAGTCAGTRGKTWQDLDPQVQVPVTTDPGQSRYRFSEDRYLQVSLKINL